MPLPQHNTAWLIDDLITVRPDGHSVPTPDVTSAGALIGRIRDQLVRVGRKEGTVLLTDREAGRLGWLDPRAESQYQRAKASLEAAGWRTTGGGAWTTCYDGQGVNVHVGLVDDLDRDGWFLHPFQWAQMVRAIDEWNRATGKAWGHESALVGVELIHGTVRPWRKENVKGNQAVVKRDEHTLTAMEELPWTPQLWSRKEKSAKWLHGYDKVRASLSAANKAKCAVDRLTNGYRKYDGKRAGWWQFEVPAWNMKELPHPCGPYARPGTIVWRTSATLDLVAELADDGLIAFPDILESWTGPARPALLPFSDLLEKVYQETDYQVVREMVKEVANAGIGMLGNADGSFYRADWMHAVWGTKRANLWRVAYRVGNAHGRYPVAIDDDKLWYGSTDADPIGSCPGSLPLKDDRSGFRYEETMEVPQ